MSERVEWGTRRMSFTIQPCGRDGRPINGGNHYSNANSLEDARDSARRMLARPDFYLGYVIRSVTISGGMYEFRGCSWAPLNGAEAEYHFERIESDLPYPYTEADLKMECYNTTVFDVYETVHEMRSDGTCKCGDPTRNVRN